MLIALIMFLTLTYDSLAASGKVTFTGVVPPKVNENTIALSQPIYTFTDQAILPVPDSVESSWKKRNFIIRSNKGEINNNIEPMLYRDSGQTYKRAVVVDLKNNNPQFIYMCDPNTSNLNKGCIQYKVIRLD